MANEFSGGHNVTSLQANVEARLEAIERKLGIYQEPAPPVWATADQARMDQLQADLAALEASKQASLPKPIKVGD